MEIKTCKACSRFCHLQTANNSPKIRQAPVYAPGAKICYPQRKLLLCGPGWWCAMWRLYSFITMVLSSFRTLFHSVHIYGNNRIWGRRTVGETEEIHMQNTYEQKKKSLGDRPITGEVSQGKHLVSSMAYTSTSLHWAGISEDPQTLGRRGNMPTRLLPKKVWKFIGLF